LGEDDDANAAAISSLVFGIILLMICGAFLIVKCMRSKKMEHGRTTGGSQVSSGTPQSKLDDIM